MSADNNSINKMNDAPSNVPDTTIQPTCTKKEEDKEDTNLEFTWICTECREAECFEDADEPLLLCDGKCNRPFHPPCANLTSVPSDDAPWLCGDCKEGRHQCTVCKEYGKDDVDVFCCDVKGCGLFFHENCLSMYNVFPEVVGGENENNEDEMEEPPKIKFRCPAHACWTCSGGPPPAATPLVGDDSEKDTPVKTSEKKKKKKGGKKRKSGALSSLWGAKKERLYRCLECPISYHLTCMPPNCSFHELAMLCHEHAYTSKLPYLDAEYSLQSCVEADAEKKIEQMKKREERRTAAKARGELSSDEEMSVEEENPFLPGMLGSDLLDVEEQLAEYLLNNNDDDDDDEGEGKKQSRKRNQFQYCLPVDIKDEVYSKPPQYTHVNTNRYDPQNKPKRHPPNGELCSCKPSSEDGVKSCGDRCFNRLNYTECVGDKDNSKNNPYLNCNCGKTCDNRSMSKRKFAKCMPQREHGKGWGLVTINGVKAGDLVQEYAGEIIDEKTKEQRLTDWTRDHPNDPNFYVMHLEQGWYIDAREIGNMARYINHSCDPNCKLVPVNVNGYMRVAIICNKDVGPGEFLCYDYQFDTQHGEKFTCRCGAKNCRGTMKGGGSGGEQEQKKTKKELIADAKARVQRDKKFLESITKSEVERLNLTSQYLPGAEKEPANLVAAGPHERDRYDAQVSRIFLWRNVVAGSDFSAKYWRHIARLKAGGKKKRKLLREERGTIDVISMIVK